MQSSEIRKKFSDFFESRNHKIRPSSSLTPTDPSVLLTTAGMLQFKPYLSGELDPVNDFGIRNVFSIQKCFRTTDIESVGDDSHLTFFEMVGNFSFGGYFKELAIPLSFEFIISKDGLGLDPHRLYVTAFEGDAEVEKDMEAIKLWQEQFAKVGISAKLGERIFLYGRKKNWWEAGVGPSGPDAEMFYDLGVPHNSAFGEACHPNCDCGRFVEIGNDVFVQYNKTQSGVYELLKQKSVDNGRGFERLVMVMQGKSNIFETDLLRPLVDKVDELAPDLEDRIVRIIVDHVRASIFLIGDGVRPSNKEAGYILRRLMRRVMAFVIKYEVKADIFSPLLKLIQDKMGDTYKEINNSEVIKRVWNDEQEKFMAVIDNGLKELAKHEVVNAKTAFLIYESFGLPFELIKELALPASVKDLNKEEFDKEFLIHQNLSRAGVEKKFGGHGLILNTGELKAKDEIELQKVVRLHTATHMLQQALREVLGSEVTQKGSDITAERARFDFSFSRKVLPVEIIAIEALVNQKIAEDLPMSFVELPKEEAVKTGALYFFKQKYPEKVKVYYIGHSLVDSWSKEFCGGPHVDHTSLVGKFRILKEEAVSAGVRRIRMTLDN